jgi:protein SCO1/2
MKMRLLSVLCFGFLLSTPFCNAEVPVTTRSVKGVVESIALNHRKATIHHQTIPGYMMEMTMDFSVKNPEELAGISKGDQITFLLHVDKDHAWIDHIHRVGSTDPSEKKFSTPTTHPSLKLSTGELLQDGDFVDERGRTRHFSDFRGKVVALTFFFTRCPIPDYCPLMNRNFEKTREILNSSKIDPKKWELISLSFDSEFDHPEVLCGYAKMYRGDSTEHWVFGTASTKTLAEAAVPLGLMVTRQGGSLAHNLRTVVLDPQGKIFRQFNDNSWTAAQLAESIQEAAKATE